ncbi:hypothetical protein F5I97DRAFT_99932 [Phlebopus sp. FC_14]|nr:hypothetical protein F5I97DRAFT_99932 [Phlebopus sp. FC_14]
MAAYLPVLLGSVTAIPDDSTLSDLPRGQVDYLSHEWREEDVWRSWRSMTRQKNEIANGVRLENASWRTWWKQRNGLKTVTPETLNWLKDSDVTWLYGPLHTADSQWTYTPKPSPSTAAALDLPSSPSPSLSQSSGSFSKKPILKHRSISELLTSDFPPSPMFSPPDSDDDNPISFEDHVQDNSTGQSNLPRPSLMRTKSDTHITRWGPNRAFRRDSPPRVVPSGAPSAAEMHSSVLQRPDAMSVVPGQRRKHISFNTFVEQCIAIDKPKKRQPSWGGGFARGGNVAYGFEDDGYDEDSEDGIIDEGEELLFGDVDEQTRTPSRPYPPTSHAHAPSHSAHSHQRNSPPSSSSTSEEDEDDEVLEMRVRHTPSTAHPIVARSSSHSSSSTSSSSHSRPSKARSANYPSNGRHWRRGSGNSFMRSPSADKELVTIALIAPTILKTKADEDEHYPHSHSHAYPRAYPHPSSVSQHGKQGYSHGAKDSPVELVYMPPSYLYSEKDDADLDTAEEDATYQDSLTPRSQFFNQPLVTSPNMQAQAPIHQEEIMIDHFEVEQQSGPNVMQYNSEMQRYIPAEQGRGPEVVVSSEDGYPERPSLRSRSRSRSKSRSRTPSPNTVTTTVSANPS